MSVASANPFALLEGQFIPQCLPHSCRKFPPLADTSRPSSPAPATQKNEAPSSQATRTGAKPKGHASRGGRYYSRGGKPKDSTQDGQDETPAGDERAPKKGESPTSFISLTCMP